MNHHNQNPPRKPSPPQQPIPPPLFHPPPSLPIRYYDEPELDSPSQSSSSSSPLTRPFPITLPHISPTPHISTQFYTFNQNSHLLMSHSILQNRTPSASEIRLASPPQVLSTWRSVWKDRNVDTAYVTAWKRIQEKLNTQYDSNGNLVLYFKNNPQQLVSYFEQWQDIVTGFHTRVEEGKEGEHLGLKETVDRIKQVWTVGAKFYGIPESYIKVCVDKCNTCNSNDSGMGRGKRRKFEYTESFECPAKEVQLRLQQLATKHKVVLCIRQKYIRYKPFMAEVKDYACHRAGDPASKKPRVGVSVGVEMGMKRDPYVSKRCGCGFRIRAIVPIANYNEKDKNFVYIDEGVATFKLYAVHSGHEPGPLDGNARIMHRMVGHKNERFFIDSDMDYGDLDGYEVIGSEDGDFKSRVFNQVQELRAELGILGEKIVKLPIEVLSPLPQQLFEVINWVRSIGDEGPSRTAREFDLKEHSNEILVGGNEFTHWGADTKLIEDEENNFVQTYDAVMPWDRLGTECSSRKSVMVPDNCKSNKWPHGDFNEKNSLECEENSKLIRPVNYNETVVMDEGLVGIHGDNFYPDNSKWYDSHCGLDLGSDCGDSNFRP